MRIASGEYMFDVPETEYATTPDGMLLAHQVVGQGPTDLLFLVGPSHVELQWDAPAFVRVLNRLTSFSRLIRFDQRGSGLSDPLQLGERPSLEDRTKDILTILDWVGAERVAVVANNIGGLPAMFLAASHPERVSSLVLHGCYARFEWAEDFEFGMPREVLAKAAGGVAGGATAMTSLDYLAPHPDPDFAVQWRRYIPSAASPSAARVDAEVAVFSDVRPALASIQAPSLVLYRKGDRLAGRPHAQYLAEHIASSKLVELPGRNCLIFAEPADADLDEIQQFLTGSRHTARADRALATLMFTDIVGSTEHAAAMGDLRWREVLDAHDDAVRRQLKRFGGREVNTAGDGFLATFDGPGRAIVCACAIRDAVRGIGLEVRAGLHTGEVEIRGEDVAGMAVHIGARVASAAGPGEVLVSGAVPPLVAGSAIQFEDRGDHELKGVPGAWRLFSVLD